MHNIEKREIPNTRYIKTIVNGRTVLFNTSPIIQNGVTLIPAKKTFEELGFNVQWNEKDKTITATNIGTQIKLIINSKIGYVNDKEIEIDVAPIIINGNTFVPIRFIAENINKDVNWNNEERIISIEDKDTMTVMIDDENVYKVYFHPHMKSNSIFITSNFRNTSCSLDSRYDIYFNILGLVSSDYTRYDYKYNGNGTALKNSSSTLYPDENKIIVEAAGMKYEYSYTLSDDKKTMYIKLNSPNRVTNLNKQREETLKKIKYTDIKNLPSIGFDEIIKETYFENDTRREIILKSIGKERKKLKTLYFAKKENFPLKISENTIITDIKTMYEETGYEKEDADPYDYRMIVDFQTLIDTNSSYLEFGFVKDSKLFTTSILHFDLDSDLLKKVKLKGPTFFEDLPNDGGSILKSGEIGTVFAGGYHLGKVLINGISQKAIIL